MGMKLTVEQQELVTKNIHLVNYVINKYIKFKKDNIDLDFEDLRQIGSIGLCNAASKYNKSVQFNTFAEIVIRNELVSYCKKLSKKVSTVSLENGEFNKAKLADPEENTENTAEENMLMKLIAEKKTKYSGVELKGLEVLELKLRGVKGSDIAKMYNVKSNHISAWMSKAKSILLSDEELMKKICCK